MKRFFSVILTLALLMSCVPFAALANNTTADVGSHVHNWVTDWTEDATCTEPGQRGVHCSICYTGATQTIPARGHYYPNPWKTVIEPTCTAEGTEMNTCVRVNGRMVCGYEWYRALPATGHDWGEWYVAKQPTAEEDGYEERECGRCHITETRPLTLDDEGEDEGDIGDMELYVEKTEISVPANGSYYTAGETIIYSVSACNCQDYDLYDVCLYDRQVLEGEETKEIVLATGDVLASHASIDCKYSVVITEDDIAKGDCYVNVAYGDWVSKHGEESVTNRIYSQEVYSPIGGVKTVSISKEVYIVPANGSYYAPGETVTFFISVSNDTSQTIEDIYFRDPLITDENLECGPLEEGTSIFWYIDYVITEEDAYNGHVDNVATVYWSDPASGEERSTDSNTVSVACGFEDYGTGISITKFTYDFAANGKFFVPGECIIYYVTIKNYSDEDITDVVLADSLFTEPLFEAPVFKAGEVHTSSYSYYVTEADALNGFADNIAVLSFTDSDGMPSSMQDSVRIICGCDSAQAVVVDKYCLNSPANGVYFVPGEEIKYRINVTNVSGSEIHGIEVIDPIKGTNEDMVITTSLDLVPLQSAHYYYSYIVTENDALNGMVVNAAAASYWDETAGNRIDVISNYVIVPADSDTDIEEIPHINVVKNVDFNPANGSFCTEGENVVYRVKFINDSDEDVYNITVYDILNGPDEASAIGSAEKMAAHSETDWFSFTYCVSAEDCENGNVTNQANARWEIGNEAYNTPSNIVTIPCGTEEAAVQPVVNVTKTVISSPANGYAYTQGEYVSFLITVTNAGDVELVSGNVLDNVFNNFHSADTYLGNRSMAPHTTLVYPFSYQVTDWDVLAGYVADVARCEYSYINEDGVTAYDTAYSNMVSVDVCPGRSTEDTILNPVTIKVEASTPANGSYYTEGEYVEYDVVLYNPTERVFYDVNGYDILLTTPGYFFGSMSVLDSTPATMHIVYQIDALDVSFGSVTNTAWATMKDDIGNIITVYSNEVIVYTDKNTEKHDKKGDSCRYRMTASGDGIEVFVNDFCHEHSGLDLLTDEIITGASDKAAAYRTAGDMWLTALYTEYERIIESSEIEKASALKQDLILFVSYVDTYTLLKRNINGDEDAYQARLELLRDRTCEICSMEADAPELKDGNILAVEHIPADNCSAGFESVCGASFTLTLNVCNKHIPIVNAVKRLYDSAKDDERLSALAYQKTLTYWQNVIDGVYEENTAGDNAWLKAVSALERSAFEAMTASHARVYEVYYPNMSEYTDELYYRIIFRHALEMCALNKD